MFTATKDVLVTPVGTGDWRTLPVILILMSLASTPFGSSVLAADGEQLIDRVVAVVDGEPVLHSSVMVKVSQGPLVVVSDYPAPDDASPYQKALNDLINFKLIIQSAHELEIDVRDEEVEAEIERFLSSRGLDREGLLQFLGQQGRSFDEYKADFRDQMLLRRFQGRVIAPQIKITDKDVETYYLKKVGTTSELVELTLRQILIRVEPGAPVEVAEAKQELAQEVYQKLVGGTAFEDAARIYSDDPAARSNGGRMTGIRLRDLAEQIRVAVEPLEAGGFTAPIRTGLGYHIFLMEEKKFSGNRDFEDQKDELEFELRTIELNNQTRRWLSEQRQKIKVEIID